MILAILTVWSLQMRQLALQVRPPTVCKFFVATLSDLTVQPPEA